MSGAGDTSFRLNEVDAIVIGASAGAISALSAVLLPLPADFPAPILIVVHQPPDKTNALSTLFQSKCAMKVKEAEDKEPISDGTIYFAPPDYHLLVEGNELISLSSDELVNFSRPAIDVLFESAADAYGSRVLALVLTGANHDGAKGAGAICAGGGKVIVQSPQTAEARMMPESAIAACPTARVLDLNQIADVLLGLNLSRHE